MRIVAQLYLPNRFFAYFAVVAGMFAMSYAIKLLLPIAITAMIMGGALVLLDIMLLYRRKVPFLAERELPELLSLGDENLVTLKLRSNYEHAMFITVIDELPSQLQNRDQEIAIRMEAGELEDVTYSVRPLERGVFSFGKLHLYMRTSIGMIMRGAHFDIEEDTKVYPSVIQMKRFELRAFTRISHLQGIKKVRRLGHSYEFELIKNYVEGDDIRSINWKATGRRSDIMVNHYEDEKSQQVYSVIDKSRSMALPFHGLSLMDHAINTSLVISNIALLKHDKAGLLTFSDRVGSLVKADRQRNQLKRIMEALYAQEERTHEANFELLYSALRQAARRRSLVILYTNFESMYAMHRVLPILRKLSRMHLLLVMFFENTEISAFTKAEAETTEEMYIKTIAEKYTLEKKQIITELRQFGIHSLMTRPEDLTVNTINKYIEFKARGLI